MNDIIRKLSNGVLTIVVLVFWLGMASILMNGSISVLRKAGYYGFTTGWPSMLIFIAAFVMAFAITFGGLTLWYGIRS